MDDRICSAIRRRQVMAFDYDGLPRVVEPHAHGTSLAGKEMLRAYQVKGQSASDPNLGWRPFIVAKMVRVRVLERTFAGTRPLYRRGDRGMRVVHCEL